MNSSTVASKFIATITSWISSEPCGPMTAAPKMRPFFGSAIIFTKPLVLPKTLRLAVLGEIVAADDVADAARAQLLLARRRRPRPADR